MDRDLIDRSILTTSPCKRHTEGSSCAYLTWSRVPRKGNSFNPFSHAYVMDHTNKQRKRLSNEMNHLNFQVKCMHDCLVWFWWDEDRIVSGGSPCRPPDNEPSQSCGPGASSVPGLPVPEQATSPSAPNSSSSSSCTLIASPARHNCQAPSSTPVPLPPSHGARSVRFRLRLLGGG